MHLFHWNRHKDEKEPEKTYPTIKTTIDQIRRAINEFAKQAREGVSIRVLVNDDHTINTVLLAPYLKGLPEETYYMSRETFEVFEEEDKDIAIWSDKVQVAVDGFIHAESDLPIIPGHPKKKVNFFLLQNKGYLKETPPMPFYITDQEYLITHREPK